MDLLISDRAQAEISNKVKDILCHLCIDDWQSEPHYHHQNAAEWRYRWVKHATNQVLNSTGATSYCWLLCIMDLLLNPLLGVLLLNVLLAATLTSVWSLALNSGMLFMPNATNCGEVENFLPVLLKHSDPNYKG